MSSKERNPLDRFIGKVLQKKLINKSTNESFDKFTVLLDNPEAFAEDGSQNKYYQGHLVWVDPETNTNYIVKSIDLTGVGKDASERGFINSLKINLGNEYNVKKLS